jgi:nucleoside-diphosphate-sugar epimerase
MSVFRFVRQICEGEPITIFGDGAQSRDFTYVDDIARGTIAALKPMGFAIINLGGDRPVELMEVVRQIAALAGRSPVIQYRGAHPADVPATWASIERAKYELGWSPETYLVEGLRACIAWFSQNRDLACRVQMIE